MKFIINEKRNNRLGEQETKITIINKRHIMNMKLSMSMMTLYCKNYVDLKDNI